MNKLSFIFSFLLLFSFGLVNAQQPSTKLKVTGKVISNETLKPLPNASIGIKGSKKGVIADSLGNFTIRVDKGQTIVVGYTSFEPQEFKVYGTMQLDVNLVARSIDNEEVVVVGYGTRKKSHSTGAISKLVTDEYIGQIPVSRADDALKGKLAGVNIITTDAQAGAAPTIQIRGATSITAGTEPLIVIDGYPVPTDLSSVDMNDVESIEVLKDAASAAIYGSRGGNGVIIITTKSGKIGKTRFSFNVSRGTKNVYRKIPIPSLQQWKAYVQADNDGNLTPEITQAEKFDANTNAQDFIFRSVNFTNIQLAASGGNTNFKYYLSGNGLLDNGIMIGNDYKRFGLRAGFTAKANQKTTIEFSFTPSFTEKYDVPVTVQEAIRTLAPWQPVYHNDTSSKYTGKPIGSIANQRDFSIYNLKYGGVDIASATTNSPLQQLTGTTDKTTQIRAITNFSVKIDFSKSLSFKSSVGLLLGENTRDFFQKSWAQADPDFDGIDLARRTSKAILTKTRTLDFSNENIFTFKKIVKKHDINIVAGFSNQYTNTSYFNGQAGNFATDDIPTLNAGTMQVLNSNIEEDALVSFLARVNYAYDNKYLVSVSQRTDGSSRFGPDNRWASFPSVSLGWKLSSEKFFPQNKIISDVKLRASYGATGNKNIGNYRYFANVGPAYASLGNEVTPGFQLTSFGNQALGWERTFSYNYAADFGLANGKIRLTIDYYNTETDKLLLNLPTVASSGFTSYPVNRGKVSNKGFEVEVSSTIINKKDFKWNVSGNIYTNQNKLLDFGGSDNQISQGDPKRANFFLTKVGAPLVQYYGYQMDSSVRVHKTDNYTVDYWPIGVKSLHAFVKDQDGNKMITDSDRVVLGNPYPKFNWGFTSNFQYKLFDISFTFQGSHGATVFNVDRYYFETQFSTTGANAYKNPDLYTQAQQKDVRIKTQTNFNLEDASFIALRNVNIGYTMPSKTLKKLNISKLRMYCSVANAWYHFSEGYSSFNPEADNGFPNDPLRKGYQRGAVPLARTITFGLNLDF